MKIKEVNKQLQPVERWETQPGGQFYFSRSDIQAKPGVVLEKVCGIYHRVKPVLVFVGEFWLVPKKWRDTIKQFTTLLDTLCPA